MKADPMGTARELRFIPNEIDAFLKETELCIDAGAKRIALCPSSPMAKELIAAISASHPNVDFSLQDISVDDVEKNSGFVADVTLLCHEAADELSHALMAYLDLERGIVIAPITEHYFKNTPLFLISIPKSGTHLLYKLVEAFGYTAGVELDSFAMGGTWYCVEYSNSHTSARDFFVDAVRRSPFGNRHHPFMRSPALFIYRSPLDILVSEANYYHKDGNTAFAGYLTHLSFEERLGKLIDDPWLFGSWNNRIGQFAPWLDMPNVIPVSFEELIGSRGGGNQQMQETLIWALQLKLHVSGSPEMFSEQVFDRQSPTFFKASIGSYRNGFTVKLFENFQCCDEGQRLMRVFGYEKANLEHVVYVPSRSEEFRTRKLTLSNFSPNDVPICHKYGYLGFNIIQYKARFYGIPIAMGAMDISDLSEGGLLCRQYPQAGTLSGCKREIILHHRDIVPHLLEEGFHGFNIVLADGLFFGVRQSLGEIDFTDGSKLMDKYSAENIVVRSDLEDVRSLIIKLTEKP